jgi:hypothetical protein
MVEGADNIRLSEQYETLKEMLTKNTLTTEKVLWIISDPDTGLIRRVGDIGQVTSDTVKDQLILTMQVKSLSENVGQIQARQVAVMARQDAHDSTIKGLVKCAEDSKEAKKPLVAIAYGILEKLLWIVALGLIAWLGSIVLATP